MTIDPELNGGSYNWVVIVIAAIALARVLWLIGRGFVRAFVSDFGRAYEATKLQKRLEELQQKRPDPAVALETVDRIRAMSARYPGKANPKLLELLDEVERRVADMYVDEDEPPRDPPAGILKH